MGKTRKRTIYRIASAILLLSSYIFYCWATYIDEIIKEGQAYGVEINDSKEITYQKLKIEFQNTKTYILYPLDSRGYGPHKNFDFREKDIKTIFDRDNWAFYFDEGYTNTIQLTFKNGKLHTIYRHRKNFELP